MYEPATLGIDEVGRGAWAGPVVAAAVIWPDALQLPLVRDSKSLSSIRRVQANRLIRQLALGIGIGWVAPAEVDSHGLSWAIQQSGFRAYQALQLELDWPGIIALDGNYNYLQSLGLLAQATVKADATIPAVSAASIVAKVARDNLMIKLDHTYQNYGFARHKGYGTAIHQQVLAACGPTVAHRRSVAPVLRAL